MRQCRQKYPDQGSTRLSIDLALARHHWAQVLDSLLLRHEMLWDSLGTYITWTCRRFTTQWGKTFTNGRQRPDKSFLPLTCFWVAVVYMASQKVEIKWSNALYITWWLLWERTVMLTLLLPFPTSLRLLPGTPLNMVLVHKPLPQVLFSGEPRLRQMLCEQSWRPEEPMCSCLRLSQPGVITVRGEGRHRMWEGGMDTQAMHRVGQVSCPSSECSL